MFVSGTTYQVLELGQPLDNGACNSCFGIGRQCCSAAGTHLLLVLLLLLLLLLF